MFDKTVGRLRGVSKFSGFYATISLVLVCLLNVSCSLMESALNKDIVNKNTLPNGSVIEQHLLPYVGKLKPRQMRDVDMIVIHCTELPTMALAREFGERIHYESGTGNSGHYYIDLDGSVIQYVDDDRTAHHVAGHNDHTIGIEIVNEGRYPDWYTVASQQKTHPYTSEQIDAVIALVNHLAQQYPSIKVITGHENLDTRLMPASDAPDKSIQRKVDPGPTFPWGKVLAGISVKGQLD